MAWAWTSIARRPPDGESIGEAPFLSLPLCRGLAGATTASHWSEWHHDGSDGGTRTCQSATGRKVM